MIKLTQESGGEEKNQQLRFTGLIFADVPLEAKSSFMRKIVYYVATSIDGFIAGPNNSIEGFIHEGKGVEKYFDELKDFDTVIMGRNTYEFGYNFGLKPGQPAYLGMKHYIFSDRLEFEEKHDSVEVVKRNVSFVQKLKQEKGGDIYLCGGGQFSGWMLENELIDIVKIKLNPLILNKGVPLFGDATKSYNLELLETNLYDKGLQIITYRIRYPK